jgi:aspartate aminotransferase
VRHPQDQHESIHMRPQIRDAVERLGNHKILEVVRLGAADPNIIPLWYGESDLPTPGFICKAAIDGIGAGETFYPPKRGLPSLRSAIAEHLQYLYGKPIGNDRVTVTSGAINAIMLTAQVIINPEDNVVVVTPAWPNPSAAVSVLGGVVRSVDLDIVDDKYQLDTEKLFAATDSRTRAIFVNSPNNPTGWTIGREQQRQILEFCKRRGLWLLADEVYTRLVQHSQAAPSFLEIAEPDDPLIVVGSFSKSYAMTGWRLGWLIAPAKVGAILDNLVDYNVSGVPLFVQRAGLSALLNGEEFVETMKAYCKHGLEIVSGKLEKLRRVQLVSSDCTFYAYFRVEGQQDTLAFAKRCASEFGVGLAPGVAFGPASEGWLRLCCGRSPLMLAEAMMRLERAILG